MSGGPPQQSEDLKSEVLRIPLTADQKESLNRAADEFRLPIATWARDILMKAAEQAMRQSPRVK